MQRPARAPGTLCGKHFHRTCGTGDIGALTSGDRRLHSQRGSLGADGVSGMGPRRFGNGFDEVVRELYRTDPSEFITLRDGHAAEARRNGDDELASAIKKLRKPTLAAWAVNLLAARERERFDALLAVGERLRSAQRNLRGAEIRQLDRERARALADLTGRGVRLAGDSGHPLGDQARQQIEQTLNAALSDPESADLVRAGTLTKPLEYSGFGLDELSAAAVRRSSSGEGNPRRSAAKKRGGRRMSDQPGTRGGTVGGKRQERGKGPDPELADARADLDRAGNELREVDERLEQAENDRKAAEQRRAQLRDELEQCERDVRESDRTATRLRRSRQRAQREYDSAQKRVAAGEDDV